MLNPSRLEDLKRKMKSNFDAGKVAGRARKPIWNTALPTWSVATPCGETRFFACIP